MQTPRVSGVFFYCMSFQNQSVFRSGLFSPRFMKQNTLTDQGLIYNYLILDGFSLSAGFPANRFQ